MVHLTSKACSVLAITHRDYGAPCSMLAEPASGARVLDEKFQGSWLAWLAKIDYLDSITVCPFALGEQES